MSQDWPGHIYDILTENKDFSRSAYSNELSCRQSRDSTMLIHFLKVPSLVMHFVENGVCIKVRPRGQNLARGHEKMRHVDDILKSRKSHSE